MRERLDAQLGVGDPDDLEQLDGPLLRRRPGQVLVDLQRLDELEADGVDRRERRQRVLEDHRQLVPADLRHPPVALAEQLLAVQRDRAGDLGVRRQQAHDRQRGDRLPRAGLADDAEHLAGGQIEVDAADRLDDAVLGRELDVQVA